MAEWPIAGVAKTSGWLLRRYAQGTGQRRGKPPWVQIPDCLCSMRLPPGMLFVVPEGKKCARCGTEKTLEEFSRSAKNRDGFQAWCKKCAHAHRTNWAKANPEKVQSYRLWSSHRLTKEDWESLYLSQGGLCAVCKSAKAGKVDHDHSCCPSAGFSCGNCVRGLVCARCNTLVGYYERDPKSFSDVLRYLGVSDFDAS